MNNLYKFLKWIAVVCVFFAILPSYAAPLFWERSFEDAMGKGTASWKFIETKEDKENLAYYQNFYDKYGLIKESGLEKIPKVLHFIWLGPKEIPEQTIKAMTSWIEKHPTWKVKLWTDQNRPQVKDMEQVVFAEYPFLMLSDLYYDTENFGEKSEILRYEILSQEGGVYVDHDMLCLKSIDPLVESYDFFCPLEALSSTVLSSSVMPSTHMLASKPHHPTLAASMEWLKEHWTSLGEAYPGTEEKLVHNRVKHRSFSALEAGIKSGFGHGENRDVVFPSSYFSLSDPKMAIYATHAHRGLWYKKDNPLMKKFQSYASQIQSKQQFSQLLIYTLTFIQIALFTLLIAFFRRIRKPKRHI